MVFKKTVFFFSLALYFLSKQHQCSKALLQIIINVVVLEL